jgi:GNAT superfamily N-acetyltransferase
MLNLVEIARREEGRCALGVSEVAHATLPILGGSAARDAPGTWANTAVGLGLDPTRVATLVAEHGAKGVQAEVDRMIAWYVDEGIEPRVELCPFAEPALVRALAEAGFILRQFEHVFFRELKPGERFETPSPPPAGLELRVVDASDRDAVATFARVVNEGFVRSDPAVVEPTIRPEALALYERCVRHPRTVAIGAWLDGQCVGGGMLERLGDLAGLFALSVLPEHRRRGIQQSVIAARLRMAAESGAVVATIIGPPGMPTERNVRRFGFQVAYTKAIVVRPGPGLVPAA